MADPRDILQQLSAPPADDAVNAPSQTDALLGLLTAPSDELKKAPSVPGGAPDLEEDPDAHTGTFVPIKKVAPGKGLFGSQYTPAVPKMITKGIPAAAKEAWSDISAPGDILRGQDMTPEEMGSHARGIVGLTIGGPGAGKAAPAIGDASKALRVPAARTQQELFDASQVAYKAADDAGATLKPEAFSDFVDGLKGQLRRKGYNPDIHTNVSPVVSVLDTAAADGTQKTFPQLVQMREQAMQALMASKDKANRGRARQIVSGLEDLMKNAQPHQLVAGDSDAAYGAWRTANDLYAKQAKMGEIQQIVNTASKLDNGPAFIKQKFNAILKNPSRLRTYTPEQQDIISDVVNKNALEKIGSLLPYRSAGGVGGVLGGTLGLITGGSPLAAAEGASLGAAGLPILEGTLKAMGQRSRLANIPKLQENISRGGSPPSYFERLKAERAARLAGQP